MSFKELKIYKKNIINKNNLLLSSSVIALDCDYIICNRFDNNFPNKCIIETDEVFKLKSNDKLFLNGERINDYIDKLIFIFHNMGDIKLNIFIGNCEPCLQYKQLKELIPYSNNIYMQNNSLDLPNIHILPIGIRDDGRLFSAHSHFHHDDIINEKKINRSKDFMCYYCFSEETNFDRLICKRFLENKDFVLNMNKKYGKTLPYFGSTGSVPLKINYEMTHRSLYTLCPIGKGMDTHRFYEALYLNSIPIVKKNDNSFDKLYHIFPCLIVHEWTDVTLELLSSMKRVLQYRLKKLNEDYPNWYSEPNVLYELLNKT